MCTYCIIYTYIVYAYVIHSKYFHGRAPALNGASRGEEVEMVLEVQGWLFCVLGA